MKIQSLQIGDLISKLPIIQGGMGVGVSSSKLASAVANAGGIGIISGAQIGYDEEDFYTNNLQANLRAFKKHIKKAKENALNGIIGVNLMVAMKQYDEHVKAAIESGVDLIISGAGLPTSLPKLTKGFNVKLVPIVSSLKACNVILKIWDKHHGVVPDAIIVEGPKAGGHLGFSKEELLNDDVDFDKIIIEVVAAVKSYEEKYNKSIPVIAAGGIYTGEDIAKYLKIGASGVQMATRFVTTEECDAHINFKQAYLNSSKDDISFVKSPAGMPGRAIINPFIGKVEAGDCKVTRCYSCLTPCNPATTPYCITEALINSVKGDVDNGLLFCGENAYKIDSIITVQELMDELTEGILKS